MNWKKWLYGFISAVVGGVASGIVVLLAGLANDPMSGEIMWTRLGMACVVLGIWNAANYLAKAPAPEWDGVDRRES